MAVAPTLWFDPLCKWGLVNFIFVTSKLLHYFPSLISWWGLLTNEVMPHLKRSYTKWIQQVHYFSSRECVKAVQWFASIAAQPLGLFFELNKLPAKVADLLSNLLIPSDDLLSSVFSLKLGRRIDNPAKVHAAPQRLTLNLNFNPTYAMTRLKYFLWRLKDYDKRRENAIIATRAEVGITKKLDFNLFNKIAFSFWLFTPSRRCI